jgi:hypothetical protein
MTINFSEPTKCRVSLNVFGGDLELSQVSERLDLLPTREYLVGEKIPPHSNGITSERVSEFNMWVFKIDVDELRPLEEHFFALVELLVEQRIEQLKVLSSQFEVTIQVYITNDAGIEIPVKLMAVLSTCGIPILIDVQN